MSRLIVRRALSAALVIILILGLAGFASTAVPSQAASPSSTALAWGWNYYGQLGNTTNTDSNTPVAVNLPAGTTVTAIAAGFGHSLALTSTGAVLAWGDNALGDLGNGTNTYSSNVPVYVSLPAGTTVTAISAGSDHSLALTSTGAVLAWGWNYYGQLGNTTNTDSNVPVYVKLPVGTTVTAIAAGGWHSLALTSTGAVLAWGDNYDGELGNGTNTSSNTPVYVKLPAGTTVTAIAADGYHSLALTSTGEVLAWGDNGDGELGNGSNTDSNTPVAVSLPGGTTVTTILAGFQHSLALTSSGAVLAWGDNSDGQLGDGGTADSNTPVYASLPAGTNVTAIAAGSWHSLALTSSGAVLAWGLNSFGQLGNGTNILYSDTPVAVSLPVGMMVTAIAAGDVHSLALEAAPQINLKQGAAGIASGGSYNFGSRTVSSNTSASFTIENTGSASLNLTTPLTVSGNNSDQFNIVSQPASTIAASGNTTFSVSFNPGSIGAKNAEITINNNSSDSAYVLNLTGSGVSGPGINLKQGSTDIASGGSYNFGTQTVSSNSSATFTIENPGGSGLSLATPLAISGANASQFSIVSQPVSTIAASGNTTFTVGFKPTTAGTQKASIDIINDSSNQGSYVLNLTGSGAALTLPVGGGLAIDPNQVFHSIISNGFNIPDTFRVNGYGLVQNAVQFKSKDGQIGVDIAAGTYLRDSRGAGISSFNVVPLAPVPEPTAGQGILLAYDFGPHGATFSPSLTITLSYDRANLPAGVTETSLYIGYFDGTAWQPLPSTVDTGAETVSTPMSYFTSYAILYPLPAAPAPTSVPATATAASPTPASTPAVTPTVSITPTRVTQPKITPSPSPLPSPSSTAVSLPASTPATSATAAVPALTTSIFSSGLIIGIIGAIIVVILIIMVLLTRRKKNP